MDLFGEQGLRIERVTVLWTNVLQVGTLVLISMYSQLAQEFCDGIFNHSPAGTL